jgi:hypothetical protein
MLSLRPVVVRGGKARMTSQGEFMRFRFTPMTLFGPTAMLALGATLAAAQDTSSMRPRSDRRIPVSKEAPGEVVRTDTVMIYRTDTLQLTTRVVDTVRVTRTRVDTVMPRLAAYHYPRGFYGGIAGGFSTPSGSIYVPNSTGGTAQIQLGWQNAKQVFGARFDVNGAWPGRDSRFSAFQDQARIYNFSLDGKVQWPFTLGSEKYTIKDDPCEPARKVSRGPFHRFAIYGLGGFTWTTYRDLPFRIHTPDTFNGNLAVFDGNQVIVIDDTNRDFFFNNANNRVAFFVPGEDDWHNKGGWNAGGGISMLWGHSELFVEARVLSFKPEHFDAPRAQQVPVVVGLNWY